MMGQRFGRTWIAAVAAGLMAGSFATAQEVIKVKPAPVKPEAAKASESPAEPVAKGKSKDFYQVPSGNDVGVLMNFIEKMEDYEPTSDADAQEHDEKSWPAIQEACQKIVKLETNKASDAYQFAQQTLLEARINELEDAEEVDRRKIIAEVGRFVAASPKTPENASLAMSLCVAYENVADDANARELYVLFGRMFERSEDADAARQGKTMLGASRRVDLVGKPLFLTGKTLSGRDFDIRSFKGKIVLVDFWATWCDFCVDEFPAIESAIEKYGDDGLVVVGINLDEDREAVVEFLKENKLPWTQLYHQEDGPAHPAATYYGVTGLPTTFLVGKDGKVVSTECRGADLEKEIKKLLADDKEKTAVKGIKGLFKK